MGSGVEILLNVEWYGPVIVDEYASSDWAPGEEHDDAPRTDLEIAKRACEEAKDSIVNGTSTIFIVYYHALGLEFFNEYSPCPYIPVPIGKEE